MTNSYNTGSGAQGTAAKNNFNVMVFENLEFGRVRMIQDKDGEPLFCGKDVCEVLGYKKSREAVHQHVNPHDAVKHGVRVACGKKADGNPAMKLINMIFVNESGFYADNVLDSISCYTTTQIAKELGITAQELNRSLCACHVQYYQSGQYLLYADYAHMGLAKSRTRYKMLADEAPSDNGEKTGRIFTHTYLVWTERGRKFIHDLAKRMLEEGRFHRLIAKA